MKIIVPVAGLGTRLRPLTYAKPKPLLPVGDKPILGHIFDRVAKLNPEEIILITSHMEDQIEKYIAEFDFKVKLVHQDELLGLGHAIYLTKDFVDTPVLIILGDTLVNGDLPQFVNTNANRIGLCKVSDPSRFGVAVVESGRITKLVEKPKTPISNLAIIGTYFITDYKLMYECLEEIIEQGKKTRGEFQFTDALDLMLKRNAILEPFTMKEWLDCGTLETLLRTNKILLERIHQNYTLKDSIVIPPSYIHPTAEINHSIIGPYASIHINSKITNSIIEDCIIDCEVIIESCSLKHSIIGEGAKISGKSLTLFAGAKTYSIT